MSAKPLNVRNGKLNSKTGGKNKKLFLLIPTLLRRTENGLRKYSILTRIRNLMNVFKAFGASNTSAGQSYQRGLRIRTARTCPRLEPGTCGPGSRTDEPSAVIARAGKCERPFASPLHAEPSNLQQTRNSVAIAFAYGEVASASFAEPIGRRPGLISPGLHRSPVPAREGPR